MSATFLNSFLSHITSQQTTYSLSAESIYDWESNQWLVPVQTAVSQLVMFGSQPVQFTGGARYYAEAAKSDPEWGFTLFGYLVVP